MPMQARIGAAVVCDNGDLRAVAGIARGTLDLDQALADFRHFDAEQFDHEFRRGARNEQLRPALLGSHLVQITTDPVAGTHGFARNRAVTRNISFGIAAEIQVHAATLDALNDAGDEFADAILVGFDDLGALGFTHALHDDLLGCLRRDAAEFRVLDRLLDEFADLDVSPHVDGVHQADLPVRRFHDDVIGHDFPAAEGFVFAGVLVDADARRDVFVGIALLRRGGERRFHRVEDDVFFDALFVGNRVNDQ
jgi:hypothetical protein